MLAYIGSAGAAVALKLLKERADSAEALAAAATRQVAELKASLQVDSGCNRFQDTKHAFLIIQATLTWCLFID